MSWGYFADLDISLPTAAWKRLMKRKPTEFALASGWSGLKEKGLETAFGEPNTRDETFAKVVAWKCYRGETIHEIEQVGDETKIHICLLCDKSLLDLAYPLAALFEAARGEGGSGSFRLVNDGTSVGEDGVVLTLAKGKIKKARIDDCWEINEPLVARIYGIGGDEEDETTASKKKPRGVNPFTGEVIGPKKTKKKPKRKTRSK